MEFT
jgi:hypothetical protein